VTRIVFVIGAGGVGKTTTAGALAVAASGAGVHTLVMTVDPARRLAQALGLEALGNTPITVAPLLDAAMLDAAASWQSLVRRHTDVATAERLIASRYFQAIAERFPAGQAYAVAEETERIVAASTYDLVVVDTPPVGGGVDFFEAPRHIRTLVAGRALRVLTGPSLPGRRLLYGLTARPALRLADRVLGGPLLEDLGTFLLDLRTTYDGIRDRAATVERLVTDSEAIVVTTPDPGPADEARRLIVQASERRRQVVLNRVVPAEWIGLGNASGDAYDRNLAAWATEALRHESVAESLTAAGAHVTTMLWMSSAPTSLEALGQMAHAADLERLVR
jgi:anion-transporting  ArsA/GET3 family ATPase